MLIAGRSLKIDFHMSMEENIELCFDCIRVQCPFINKSYLSSNRQCATHKREKNMR